MKLFAILSGKSEAWNIGVCTQDGPFYSESGFRCRNSCKFDWIGRNEKIYYREIGRNHNAFFAQLSARKWAPLGIKFCQISAFRCRSSLFPSNRFPLWVTTWKSTIKTIQTSCKWLHLSMLNRHKVNHQLELCVDDPSREKLMARSGFFDCGPFL